MRKVANIFWLGLKELRSFSHDFVLLALVVYSFSLAVIMQARSNSQELHNASIAVVDEDHSELSRRSARAFLPPLFQPVRTIAENSGVDGAVIADDIKNQKSDTIGYNPNTGEYVDMYKAGIVDPTKVARSALQNAASIASLMLTTEVMITKIDEDEPRNKVAGSIR